MTHIEYFVENLNLKIKIPLLTADSALGHLAGRSDVFWEEEFYRENIDLLQHLRNCALRQEYPVLLLEEKVFGYAALWDADAQNLWILGPVLLCETRRDQLWNYRGITGFITKGNVPALLSLNDLLQTLHLLFFALTGRQMDISAFLHENDISPSALPRIEPEELTRLQLSAAADEQSHHTYLEEQALWDKVRQGLSYQEIFQDDPRFHSGQVAKNSFKQDEYLCVATITLLTRAAIEAGLPPANAYGLSDLSLQKLEKCADQIAIRNLSESAWQTFLSAIRDSRRASAAPSYISACKNYIASHRTRQIRVAELAKIAGVSHSYLSKKFREYEGMTIQQYILKEKINAAANMLRYSNFSLTEIADYLNFTSQSHLGQCFKKEYHMTPRQYREKFRVREFSSND